jgi:hypothetical protein
VITLLAILGGLGFLGLVIGSVLVLFDTPARDERLRLQAHAQDAAWKIQQQTRAAINQMLDEARRQRP